MKLRSVCYLRYGVLVPTVLCVATWLCGCDQRSKPPRAHETALAKIKIMPDSKALYTYFDGARFNTVSTPAKVPSQRRNWVRVVMLNTRPEHRNDHGLVYVADLGEEKATGYPYVVTSRQTFEVAARNGGRTAAAPKSRPSAAESKQAVILYATSWCPACKSARRYMTQRGIAFIEKDIEKDPQAAAELMSKARRAGISTSGVPVLDVHGQLMQGFDPARLNTLLTGKG